MSLEDDFSDVVSKALSGLEIGHEELASSSAVDIAGLGRILEGEFDEDILRKIAPILRLDGDALAALPNYSPNIEEPVGVHRIELPFREWTVNAWRVEKEGTCLLFDTGWGPMDILSEVDPEFLDTVFITHAHPDHIGGLDTITDRGVKLIRETEALREGVIEIGPFKITAVDLSGHFEPSTGYFVEGLDTQLLVVGDALFAGSIGGCTGSRQFRQAMATISSALKKASDGCLLLPGHGPITSIESELKANPFRFHFR